MIADDPPYFCEAMPCVLSGAHEHRGTRFIVKAGFHAGRGTGTPRGVLALTSPY